MTTKIEFAQSALGVAIGDAATFTTVLTEYAVNAAPNIIAAAVILIGGFWLASRAEHGVRRVLERQRSVDPMLRGLGARIARYIIVAVALVAALGQLGIETTSLLAVLGAIGLAVGLALQGTLANVAAGIMLLWLRPFRIGDFVEVNSEGGTITELGLFATTLTTVEGVYVFVPNGEIWNKKLINYSRMPRRMVRETFTISYEDDISKAREVLLSIVSNDPRVHASPEPLARVIELGDSAVVIELRAWTDTGDYIHTKCDTIEQCKVALEGAGLSIPYPQRDVHVYSANADQELA